MSMLYGHGVWFKRDIDIHNHDYDNTDDNEKVYLKSIDTVSLLEKKPTNEIVTVPANTSTSAFFSGSIINLIL